MGVSEQDMRRERGTHSPVFKDRVVMEELKGEAVVAQLYQQIGQMKVEPDCSRDGGRSAADVSSVTLYSRL